MLYSEVEKNLNAGQMIARKQDLHEDESERSIHGDRVYVKDTAGDIVCVDYNFDKHFFAADLVYREWLDDIKKSTDWYVVSKDISDKIEDHFSSIPNC